ncbi:unnamed protein product [Brassica napus]|uniref:(rape) hypothetical protein n=1 Tax=Brassica napus TaxID=3708 RepID=A0A817AMB9_BRANA|nr:unnamed protein product [Brassica napus]
MQSKFGNQQFYLLNYEGCEKIEKQKQKWEEERQVAAIHGCTELRKKHSQKLKSPRSSSCHCEAISDNKLQQDSAHQGTGLPMKSLLAQEMSKQKESKKRSPSIIARLMGLDVLPSSQSSSHRQHKSVENQKQQGRSGEGSSYKSLARSSKGGEQKFKDVFEVLDAKKAASNRNLYHQAANLTQAEMAFIRQKFMEAKRLSTHEKLRHSKEFNDTLEALDSNKDLLLKFLQQPDSLFTKHLHDLQTTPHKKSPNGQRHVDSHSHRHGGGGCHSHSHTRHASYDTLDLKPTNIVVLKPNHGEPRYVNRAFASPSSSSDEFRADRRLPCTSNHSRQKSNEDIRLSRHSSRDSGEFSKIMSRQRKASRGNGSSVTSFETSGFRGYAGDESSSGSDSPSESELIVPVTSRTRTVFNRKNYHRSSPSKSSTTSSVTREAKRRLSERWNLTHKHEEEIEIRRSGTLAEMLAASDREARPASFNGLIFEEGISKRVEWTELPEPVGISSRDGWKGLSSRSFSKSKTIMNQESTYGYTIVLPKELNRRNGLLKGSSSHHGESQSYLSSKSSRPGSYKSHSSYNSSPEVNMSPSLTKFLYQKEKLSPKARYSFSVDANSDTEDDSSASDDMKTAMSSEAPDLSTVTSLTDPDISRMPPEDVNHSSVPEPQSRESSKEGDQPSPVSVLEASFDDDVSSSSECFESVSADLQGRLRKQLQLLKLESAAYNEGGMLVSSDEDTDHVESSTITDENLIREEVKEEDWKSQYLVDLLANSRFGDSDHTTVVETPVDSFLFEDLEKKYSSVKTSTRLDRKFLFDQISRELMQILKQFSDPHPWVKPTRVGQKWDTNMIQERLRDLVTRKDGKPSKDDVEEELQWLRLEDDIEIIGREIEEMLTDELLAELVIDAIF